MELNQIKTFVFQMLLNISTLVQFFFLKRKVIQWVQNYTFLIMMRRCIKFHIVVKKLVRRGQDSTISVATNSTSVSNWTTLNCNGFTSFEACLWRENLVQNKNIYVLPLFLPTIPLQEKNGIAFWSSESVRINLRCSEGGGAGTRISNIHL